MRVGHGCAAFGVPTGTPLGGYAVQDRLAVDNEEQLEVHSIVIESSGTRFALVVADAVCVNEDLAQKIEGGVRDLGIDHCIVAATHSHSAPELGCFPGGAATPDDWLHLMTAISVRSVRSAMKNQEAATIVSDRVDVDGVASVRNLPFSPHPLPVDVIHFVDSRSRRRGIWINAPIHATVLPASSGIVSADLIGAARSALLANDDDLVWAVVSVGAAGDLSTRGQRSAQTPAECRRLGTKIATAVLEVGWDADAVGISLGLVESFSVSLPSASPFSGSGFDTAELRSIAATGTHEPVDRQTETVLQAIELTRGRVLPPAFTIPVSLSNFGAMIVVALAVEPLSSFAMELERAIHDFGYRGRIVIVGYAGGYFGYLPTAWDFQRATYETLASPFGRDASRLLMEAILHRLPLVGLERME